MERQPKPAFSGLFNDIYGVIFFQSFETEPQLLKK
jgi:hypothetical protein